jgi:SAM-dependent methyltransferase
MKKYQDFVIKDGRLVGEWNQLYSTFSDPWLQSEPEAVQDSRRFLVDHWCRRLSSVLKAEPLKVMEVGCGLGHMTRRLSESGHEVVGVDISEEAIVRAKDLYPNCNFSVRNTLDDEFFYGLDVDVFVLAEVTWYMLDGLSDFLRRLRDYAIGRKTPVYLVHLLVTYGEGVQKYGLEYFSDLLGIEGFFRKSGFEIVESADFFRSRSEGSDTFLVATPR